MKKTRKIRITVDCQKCGESDTFNIDPALYAKWKGGTPIEMAMPKLSKARRQLLIDRTCDACWKKMWIKGE